MRPLLGTNETGAWAPGVDAGPGGVAASSEAIKPAPALLKKSRRDTPVLSVPLCRFIRILAYLAIHPPSTTRTAPLTKSAAEEARKTTAP